MARIILRSWHQIITKSLPDHSLSLSGRLLSRYCYRSLSHLRKYNGALALGAVGFRIVEGIFVLIGTLSLLSLLTLSQEFVSAGTSAASSYQASGNALVALRDWAHGSIVLIAFSLGTLLYSAVLYTIQTHSPLVIRLGVFGSSFVFGSNPLQYLQFKFWSHKSQYSIKCPYRLARNGPGGLVDC